MFDVRNNQLRTKPTTLELFFRKLVDTRTHLRRNMFKFFINMFLYPAFCFTLDPLLSNRVSL